MFGYSNKTCVLEILSIWSIKEIFSIFTYSIDFLLSNSKILK